MANRTYGSRRRDRGGRRRRGRRGGFKAAYAFLTLIAVCAAIVLALSVFFKIRHIEVTGSVHYSASDIQQASGVAVGDNLFGINKFTAIKSVFKKLPYVDELRVRRVLPDTLLIEVTECVPVAYTESGQWCWLMDKNGKLLERVGKDKTGGYVKLMGLTALSPAEGDSLYVPEAERPLQKSLFEVLQALDGADILPDVSELTIKSSFEIEFSYLDRFIVRLQMPCDIGVKTRFLLAAVDQLDPNDRGEIDMTTDKVTRFIPETSAPPADTAAEKPDGEVTE